MKIIDISPLISPRLAVFPGDTPFSQDYLLRIDEGSHLDLSTIHTTTHLGVHADAPSHYHGDGQTIEHRDLSLYIGDCQIIEVDIPRGQRIQLTDFDCEFESRRILFKTGSFPDPDKWNADFNSLSPDLVMHASRKGVRLIGLDTPSVDPSDSKDLPAHKAIAVADMAILEGVVLDDVEPGMYTLIALPLRIEKGDASPVRAILLPKGSL